jgi:hypothetical protein
MIPDQTFHCPHCGAPGQVKSGQPEYSCLCRIAHQFAPAPVYPWPYPPSPWQSPFTYTGQVGNSGG